jgi:hypothetical protein
MCKVGQAEEEGTRTDGRVGHDDHDVGTGGEHVDEGGKRPAAHLHTLELRLRPAGDEDCEPTETHKEREREKPAGRLYLQLSLNCLIMLEIFSWRCGSACLRSVASAMTRKVARSNNTTSSASQMSQKLRRCVVSTAMLGISACTIDDHACIQA